MSAYRGDLVWSRKVRKGVYRLVERRHGLVHDAPIRSFTGPVNADLGPGSRRGVVAVYPRCASTRPTRRCDLFEFKLTTGRERRLGKLSTKRWAEFAPSSWKGRYAFGRAATFLVDHGIPLFARYRGAGLFKSPRVGRISRELPYETDLRGSRVVYRVRVFGSAGDESDLVRSQRFRRSAHGRRCTLMRVDVGGGDVHYNTWFETPVLDGDYAYWVEGQSYDLDASSSLLRRRLPDRHCRSRGDVESGGSLGSGRTLYDPRARVPNSLAVDGGRFYVADNQGVREVTPQPFQPLRP